MATKLTTIMLADDHAVVRRGFRMILAAQWDMEVVAEVANGREAVEKAEQLQPDVCVMDVTMPELNGIEATRRLAKVSPKTRVLAHTHSNAHPNTNTQASRARRRPQATAQPSRLNLPPPHLHSFRPACGPTWLPSPARPGIRPGPARNKARLGPE